MKYLSWFFFVLLNLSLRSQVPEDKCDYYYEYSGPAGDTNSYIFYTQTQDLFLIDFCTRNVPDRLTIYTNHERTDSISFYIGTDILTKDLSKKHYYKGYAEFDYNESFEDSLLVRTTQDKLPNGYSCYPSGVGGSMRLYFRTPKNVCALICRVEGNKDINTIYSLCVKKLESGLKGRVDTVITPVCEKKNSYLSIENCIGTYHIFPDSSIKIVTEIKFPKCEDSYDGYIRITPYSDKSLFWIGPGEYSFHFKNSVCELDTSITVMFSPFCRLYIPNTIKYNTADNSFFTIFTAITIPYTISIFDRWGNLVHKSDYQTNYKGWDGYVNNSQVEGVFVYQILFEDYNQIFSGDLTVLK